MRPVTFATRLYLDPALAFSLVSLSHAQNGGEQREPAATSPSGFAVNTLGPILTVPPADPYSLALGYKSLQHLRPDPVQFNLSQGPSAEASRGMLNTAVGHYSLQALTHGEYDTCVGETTATDRENRLWMRLESRESGAGNTIGC
jgi:hypothetical protein